MPDLAKIKEDLYNAVRAAAAYTDTSPAPTPTPEPEPTPEPTPTPIPVGDYLEAVKAMADRTGGSNEAYGDNGGWALVAYRATGETVYGQKALDKLRAQYDKNHGFTDYGREQWIDLALIFEGTRPLHIQSDRDSFVSMVNRWADAELASWGPADSDQGTGGAFFGIALSMILTESYNPRSAEFLAKIGGLDASANWAELKTPIDALRSYVEHSKGGVWPEGTEYSLGTLKLLITGADALRRITGVDHTPEVWPFLKEAAQAYTLELVPGFEDALNWGDAQDTRTSHPRHRTALFGCLAAHSPLAHSMFRQHVQQFGMWQTIEAAPGWRPFYTYDPNAPQESILPLTGFASGQGVLYWHDNWGLNGKALMLHSRPKMPYVHHEFHPFGDFQLWRGGEWALTHPMGYGQGATFAATHNNMSVGGLSGMGEIRENLYYSLGPHPYLVSLTGGKFDPSQTYATPPVFLREHRRTVVFLPGDTDIIVVRDYVDGVDPKSLQTEAQIRWSYNTLQADQIMAAPAFICFYLHAGGPPTHASSAVAWTTPKGQQITCRAVSPTQAVVEDLSQTLGGTGTFSASELKHRARFDYHAAGTFYHVIQAGPALPVSSVIGGVKVGETMVTFDSEGRPVVR